MSMSEKRQTPTERGIASYQAWRAEFEAELDFERVYAEEAAKKELWLQLVEAREAAGLTQAELAERLKVPLSHVARIEKRGYDTYTLNSLRRYVQALGGGFELEVQVRPRSHEERSVSRAGVS